MSRVRGFHSFVYNYKSVSYYDHHFDLNRASLKHGIVILSVGSLEILLLMVKTMLQLVNLEKSLVDLLLWSSEERSLVRLLLVD